MWTWKSNIVEILEHCTRTTRVDSSSETQKECSIDETKNMLEINFKFNGKNILIIFKKYL